MEGYLSDVPSLSGSAFSQNPSEPSHDLMNTAKTLEMQFKERYKLLKSSYEKRLSQLSESIVDTCNTLLSDEIISELGQEKTSLAFIPAHIKEIVDSHLSSDRERYLHQSLQRIQTLEGDLLKSDNIIKHQKNQMSKLEAKLENVNDLSREYIERDVQPLKKKLENLQNEFNSLAKSSEQEKTNMMNQINSLEDKEIQLHEELIRTYAALDEKSFLVETLSQKIQDTTNQSQLLREEYNELKHQNQSMVKENNNLSQLLTAKSKEIESLERSTQEYSKELSKLEISELQHIESKENKMKALETKLDDSLSQNNQYLKESYDLKAKVKYYEEEIIRFERELILKTDEASKLEKRMALLISQVDGMLKEESDEAAKTIRIYQEKLSDLQHLMDVESMKDKRLIASLTEELNNWRSMKETSTLELRHQEEENKQYLSQIKTLQDKNASMARTILENEQNIQNFKFQIKEWELALRRREEESLAAMKQKDAEIQIAEEKLKLQYEKRLLVDVQTLEQRYNNVKNAATSDHDALRKSVELIKSSMDMAPNLLDKSLGFQQRQLEHLNNAHHQEQQNKLLHQMEMTEQRYKEEIKSMEQNHSQKISRMKETLRQAYVNIEKLRDIIEERQTVIRKQDQSIALLAQDNDHCKSQISEMQALNREQSHRLKAPAVYRVGDTYIAADAKRNNPFHQTKVDRFPGVADESLVNFGSVDYSMIGVAVESDGVLVDPIVELNQQAKQIIEYKYRMQSLNEDIQRMKSQQSIDHSKNIPNEDIEDIQGPLSEAQRTITRLNNEINAMQSNHSNEMMILENKLTEQQNENLRDQEQYNAMLENMQRKFEALVQLHDQSMRDETKDHHAVNQSREIPLSFDPIAMSFVNHTDTESSSLHVSKELIYWKSRYEELYQQVEALNREQREHQAIMQDNHLLRSLVSKMHSKYSTEIKLLRESMMKIKEDLQSQQQMISISSKMILQSLQAQAIRAIDKIKLTLQSEYQRQLERELEASRQLVIKQLHLANQDGPMDQNMAISPPKLSQEPVFRNTKTKIDPSEIPRSHFNETILDSIDSTNQRHSMTADQDYARLTKDELKTLESKLSWYESVLTVIFDCLLNNNIITSQGSAKLLNLFQAFVKTSNLASHSSRQFTSIKWILTEELQRNMNSMSSSRILAAGELEQSRQEHMMLLELSKLDIESQRNHFESKLKDVQTQLNDERHAHRQRVAELESQLREAKSQSFGFESKSMEIDSKRDSFQHEESKYKALVSQMKERERLYQDKMILLEQENMSLLQRVEEMELKVAKMRLEALHR